MEIKFKGNYIKIVPSYMWDILGEKIFDYLSDLEHKRLTKEERIYINKEVLKIKLVEFTNILKAQFGDFIGNSNPIKLLKVITKHGSYHSVLFDNKKEFRIDSSYCSELPCETIKRLY